MFIYKKLSFILIAALIFSILIPFPATAKEAVDVTEKIQLLGKPAQSQPYARNIWDMQVFKGKLYVCCGNSSNNAPASNAGPIDVLSYDSVKGISKVYTVNEEQVDIFRVINEVLYIPGHDSKDSWDFGNYYILSDSWKKVRTIPQGVHVYDMAGYNGKLYAATGTNGYSEVVVSSDNGLTWNKAAPEDGTIFHTTGYRAYTMFEFKDVLYASSKFMGVSSNCNNMLKITKEGITSINVEGLKMMPGLPSSTMYASCKLIRPVEFKDNLLYIGAEIHNDHQYIPLALYASSNIGDARIITLPESTALPYDIITRDSLIYVLASVKVSDSSFKNLVYKSTDLNTWEQVLSFNSSAFARSFEEINGDFFFGLGCDTAYMPESSGNILKVSKSAYAPTQVVQAVTKQEQEPALKTQSEANSGTKTEAKSETKTKSETTSAAKSETKAETKSETTSVAKSEAKSETKSETMAETKSETKAETKSEATSVAKSEAKSDTKSETMAETKSETKAETKSEATSVAKSEAKSDTKSETTLVAKSEAKSDTKSIEETATIGTTENNTQANNPTSSKSSTEVSRSSRQSFANSSSINVSSKLMSTGIQLTKPITANTSELQIFGSTLYLLQENTSEPSIIGIDLAKGALISNAAADSTYKKNQLANNKSHTTKENMESLKLAVTNMLPVLSVYNSIDIFKAIKTEGYEIYIPAKKTIRKRVASIGLYVTSLGGSSGDSSGGSSRRINFNSSDAKPCDIIIRDSDVYVLAVEEYEDNTFRSIVCQSRDLVNWTELFVFTNEAPAVSFEEHNGDFYFVLNCDEKNKSASNKLMKVSRNDY